jgi:hypothetical protein
MPTLRLALLLDFGGASVAVITSPDWSYSVTLARSCPFGLCHAQKSSLSNQRHERSPQIGNFRHHARTEVQAQQRQLA